MLQAIFQTNVKADNVDVVSPPYMLNPMFYFKKNEPINEWYTCEMSFLFAHSINGSEIVGALPLNHSMERYGFLGTIPAFPCNDDVVGGISPYFQEMQNNSAIQNDIYQAELRYIPLNPPNLPDGAVWFKEANFTYLHYEFAINDNPKLKWRTFNPTIEPVYVLGSVDRMVAFQFVPKRMALMSMLNDAFIQYLTNTTCGYYSQKLVQAMPYAESAAAFGIEEDIGSMFYPLVLSLQLPIYLYLFVLEKADKLRELMHMHGLPRWAYFASNILFCFFMYSSAVTVIYLCGFLAKLRVFTQTNFFTLSVFLLLWGNSMIALSLALSSIISSKRTAVLLGYIISLAGTLIAIVITVGIYSSSTSRVPLAYFIWPQFAVVRAFHLLNNACNTNFACYGSLATLSPHDELASCLLALLFDSMFFYILYLYLDNVMPREFGVAKHPLFFLNFLNLQRLVPAARQDYSPINLSHQQPGEMGINEEVALEREKVSLDRRNAPLIVEGLSKKYSGAKEHALQDLHLLVDAGECFGLLGENGAGKSTTISLLTGLHPPSAGTAWIAGHNIISDMDKARLQIGVCPQFCVLWDELTVRDHLLFYSRLKGVSKRDEKHHVEEWLEKLGLSFAADRKITMLSGGMKRRVSVGIALVGDPKIVFLDEPTTGLDPESKRQLWKILEQVRPGKAFILTTHSMIEAEILSTRIGIMAKGMMKCIGTPQHLKNSVGNLFSLKINFTPANADAAECFVKENFPAAHKIHEYQGAMEFHIPQSIVSVSEVFAKMEAVTRRRERSEAEEENEGREDSVISEWSFSQVGLEEVFRRVVEEDA